jgi:hypothetical protein
MNPTLARASRCKFLVTFLNAKICQQSNVISHTSDLSVHDSPWKPFHQLKSFWINTFVNTHFNLFRPNPFWIITSTPRWPLQHLHPSLVGSILQHCSLLSTSAWKKGEEKHVIPLQVIAKSIAASHHQLQTVIRRVSVPSPLLNLTCKLP